MNDDETPFHSSWIKLHDDLGNLCERLWHRSIGLTGLANDPRVISALLFKRTYGHARAFSLLWRSSLDLDADIVLRSAAEAAICLANLEARREQFVEDLRSDAASTTKGQIALWFDRAEAAAEAAAQTEELFGTRREGGERHARLQWESLATEAGLAELYTLYKHLSGTRVHITGLSMIGDAAVMGVDGYEEQVALLRRLQRFSALRMMCWALQISCSRHATIMDFQSNASEADALMETMGRLSREEAADADWATGGAE